MFPPIGRTGEEAADMAVKGMMTGREGISVLVSNRPLTARDILDRYRDRNGIETMFRDVKHGIDRRPAGCTSEDAIGGRIPISFPALFRMSMIRFLYPEFRSETAESISEELSSSSLTVLVGDGRQKKRVFSNSDASSAVFGTERCLFRCRKHPDRRR
jgi:transposase